MVFAKSLRICNSMSLFSTAVLVLHFVQLLHLLLFAPLRLQFITLPVWLCLRLDSLQSFNFTLLHSENWLRCFQHKVKPQISCTHYKFTIIPFYRMNFFHSQLIEIVIRIILGTGVSDFLADPLSTVSAAPKKVFFFFIEGIKKIISLCQAVWWYKSKLIMVIIFIVYM